eukprot:4063025-Prymnesium_polylepis.1
MAGDCKVRAGKRPAEWEMQQHHQFGPALQLSCNPANPFTGFAIAMKGCPEGFRMHFPCVPDAPDFQICTGEWFGMDVKKDGNIVPFHKLCVSPRTVCSDLRGAGEHRGTVRRRFSD